MFEKAFVITLPFRDDRREAFTAATSGFKSLPPIEVWPAVHGDTCRAPASWMAGDGAWGCYRSHLGILEYCLNNRVGSYIVFEDDAQFRRGFDESLTAFAAGLPDDWQQVYLGGQLLHTHSHPTTKLKENLFRPYNVNRTHCFAVSRAGMLPIYQHCCDLPFQPKEHIDHHLGRWHEDQRNRVYVPGRWLVGQNGFSSNVSGRTEDVQFFEDPETTAANHKLYDAPICLVYRGSRELLMQCRNLLHAGNQIDANGYDVGLSLAAKFSDPTPEVERWYGWIRGEVVRTRTNALPCLFHPRITDDMLLQCSFRTFAVSGTTKEEIEDCIDAIRSQW